VLCGEKGARTAGTSLAPEAWAILLASPTISSILEWKRTFRLVVAVAMPRRLDVDLASEDRVHVHEHLLPRHAYVLAHHHRVGLVEAPGERVLELARRVALERLSRPQGEPGRVHRDRAGDRLGQLVRRERIRLPIQISLANTAPVASIFIPEIKTPASSSPTTRSVGIGGSASGRTRDCAPPAAE